MAVAWEKRAHRRYYYHPYRVNGRVRKMYLAKGDAAALAASFVAERKAERTGEREALRSERARGDALERIMTELDAGCALLVAAELTAAGYYRHDRGAWRPRRGRQRT